MKISRESAGIDFRLACGVAAVAVLAVGGGGGDCGSISHNLTKRD
jgi:hypothetical protein